MKKIARRKVYDSIVQEKVSTDDAIKTYLEGIKSYQKDVKTTLDRVELTRSKSGLVHKDIAGHFRATLNNFIQDANRSLPCIMKARFENFSADIPISFENAMLLKALCVEQISLCEEYSFAAAAVLQNVIKSILQCKNDIEWVEPKSFTDIHSIIFRGLANYVDEFKKKGA